MTAAFWRSLATVLAEGHSAYLVLVGSSTSGSPGSVGARMFVSDTGVRVGTIGGGVMEYRLIANARDELARGATSPRSQVLWHRTQAPGEASGMICSGSQTNIHVPCYPATHLDTIRRIADQAEDGTRGTVVISRDGIRLVDEPAAISQPAIALSGEADGWTYREQLVNRRRVAIVGGGHCGLALTRVMHNLGYFVSVYDRRGGDVDTFARNEDADLKESIPAYRDAGSRIACPELTRVVVMTTDYPSDVDALLGILDRPFRFVGVMGSRAKINRILADLHAAGVPRARLEAIRAPVGIPIGSHTPEEIAISVAAQLIQEDARGAPG